jgi:putative ABC transport system substrate-binding protein
MLTRRHVVLGIGAALTSPRRAVAQRVARVPRVTIYSAPAVRDAMIEALGERGWVEGRTIAFRWHGAEGSEARVGEHLASTPADVLDVLVMGGPHRIRAAMQATSTIPIIGVDLESDPVASRFVKTLPRPGGNVTGIWMDLPELAGKQIQFLREVRPSLDRLGVVWDDRIGQPQFAELQAISRAARITLLPAALRLTTDIDGVMKRLLTERPQAIVLLTAPVVFATLSRIAELARQSQVPSISLFSPYPGVGGLLAYGPDFPAMWRQLAGYVDRVLRGARAGDLPVERPTKFSLIVNLKTAKDIGLSLSRSLVLRADDVIE